MLMQEGERTKKIAQKESDGRKRKGGEGKEKGICIGFKPPKRKILTTSMDLVVKRVRFKRRCICKGIER